MANKRIINDCVILKGQKHIIGEENTKVDRKITAINEMYRYLFQKGILKEKSFEYKEFDEIAYFAIDVDELIPYKDEMLTGVNDAELSVHHIFDEDYTPCLFCGAIELSWTMATYRDTCGCVGRSWECEMCKSFHYDVLNKVTEHRKNGTKNAVRELWSHIKWRE